MDNNEFISYVKEELKNRNLKAKDFKLKCVDTRRYGSGLGSTVYSWYDIEFKGTSIPGGDPWCGKFNTYAKYSFILTALSYIDLNKIS